MQKFNLTCVLNDYMPALVAEFPDLETMIISNLHWNKHLDVYHVTVDNVECDVCLYVVVNEGDKPLPMDIVYAKELIEVSISQLLKDRLKND